MKRPVLLSNSEFDYLINKKKFLKSFEYKIKSQLKKKIALFLENEFPLLLQSGLIDFNDLQTYINNNNMLLNLGKEKVAGSNPAQGFSFEHYFHCLMRKNEFLCYYFSTPLPNLVTDEKDIRPFSISIGSSNFSKWLIFF